MTFCMFDLDLMTLILKRGLNMVKLYQFKSYRPEQTDTNRHTRHKWNYYLWMITRYSKNWYLKLPSISSAKLLCVQEQLGKKEHKKERSNSWTNNWNVHSDRNIWKTSILLKLEVRDQIIITFVIPWEYISTKQTFNVILISFIN